MTAGRPAKYKPDYCIQVEKLCKLGATDKEIADFFNVCEDTIHEWKKVYPNFSESIKNGKELADANVAESLYKRAIGYEHEHQEFLVVSDGKGVGSHVEKIDTIKHYPPDSVAAIFWLKNRRSKEWRDKQEIEHSGTVNIADRIREARERAKKR